MTTALPCLFCLKEQSTVIIPVNKRCAKFANDQPTLKFIFKMFDLDFNSIVTDFSDTSKEDISFCGSCAQLFYKVDAICLQVLQISQSVSKLVKDTHHLGLIRYGVKGYRHRCGHAFRQRVLETKIQKATKRNAANASFTNQNQAPTSEASTLSSFPTVTMASSLPAYQASTPESALISSSSRPNILRKQNLQVTNVQTVENHPHLISVAAGFSALETIPPLKEEEDEDYIEEIDNFELAAVDDDMSTDPGMDPLGDMVEPEPSQEKRCDAAEIDTKMELIADEKIKRLYNKRRKDPKEPPVKYVKKNRVPYDMCLSQRVQISSVALDEQGTVEFPKLKSLKIFKQSPGQAKEIAISRTVSNPVGVLNLDAKLICELCNLELFCFNMLKDHLRDVHKDDKLRKIYLCPVPNCLKVFPVKVLLDWHTTYYDHALTTAEVPPLPQQSNSQAATLAPKPIFPPLNNEVHQTETNSPEPEVIYIDEDDDVENDPTVDVDLIDEGNFSYDQCYNIEATEEFATAANEIPSPAEESPSSTVCKKCHRIFDSDKGLKIHMKRCCPSSSSDSKKIFDCEFCGKVYKEKIKLMYHLIKVHESEEEREKPFQCSTCEKQFASEIVFTRHKRLHLKYASSTATLECDICEVRVFTDEELLKHKHSQHKRNSAVAGVLLCSLTGCDFVSRSKNVGALKRHERLLHPELLTFSCNQCEKRYSCLKFLQTHEQTHKELEIYRCHVCTRTAKTAEMLSKHLSNHNGEGIPCPECPAEYVKHIALKKHMIREHGADSPFLCTICDERFVMNLDLEQHMSQFHPPEGAEKIACTLCPREFLTKKQFNIHFTKCHRQTKEPTVRMCHECGDQFTTVVEFQRHFSARHKKRVKVKAPTVVHSCYFCPQVCPTLWMLCVHMWKHTLERPYVCHICGKDFLKKSSLFKHFEVHDKDGTFFPKSEDD